MISDSVQKLQNFLENQPSFLEVKNKFPNQFLMTELTWEQIAPPQLQEYFNNQETPKPIMRLSDDYFVCELKGYYLIINTWAFPLSWDPNLLDYTLLIFPEEVWSNFLEHEVKRLL